MSQTKRNRTTLELGHDAFLDIVANLVGILIILVVVLGTQSSQIIERIKSDKDAKISEADPSRLPATNEQMQTLAQAAMRAASAQADSDRIERTISQYDEQIRGREHQRGVIMDLLSEAKAAWDAEKDKFDEQKRALAIRNREYEEAAEKLTELQGERERLEGQQQPVVAVGHLPTPMAKTVFGDEVHFRLKGNRLSVVPIDQLIKAIRDDFERAVNGSRNGMMDAAVGPVRGYVARYAMDKSNEVVSQGGRVGMATRVQLVGMTISPLKEPIGTPINETLNEGSDLDIELAQRDPATTTVTVWVYPDSFAAFRHLKEHLYSRGFAAAARPLPMDREITGGPQGSRSSAQ